MAEKRDYYEVLGPRLHLRPVGWCAGRYLLFSVPVLAVRLCVDEG